MFQEIWPLLSVAIAIIVLLILIMKLQLNTFVALVITAMVTGILLGMPFDKIVATIETGMGGTLGHIALIFGLGAMLGKLLADGGGATQIANTLIAKLGKKYVQWAMVIASFIIGIALFFEVGLVLLIPLVFTIAKRMNVSQLKIGMPMVTALSVTHGFLPPHPGPVVIAKELGANIGEVLLYGFIVAIPVTIIAGPVFAKIAPRLTPTAFQREGDISSLGATKSFKDEELPSFGLSTFTALLPVLLMLFATLWQLISGHEGKAHNTLESMIYFIGSAGTAMLIAVVFAVFSMGIRRGIPTKQVMNTLTQAIYPIGMMLLIIGAGGAFKQVLIDGGVGGAIEKIFTDVNISPILLAWLVAAILRLALGSATVAAISTTGIVLPLLQTADVNLALVALAIGAGSIFCSHVNDAGFWMFKEYFGLTVKETFLTWSLIETIISVSGLVFVLFISLFI
ncbi:gluconate:H+ symporter [Staphylococcus pseudintermedius]|uniref:gluconate:H+ symporter n=1 Tax=Staphylococcus pseudintermedius TaxID=283734 RepID=UPI001D708E63|nr:gluconate:H+ symporter [Staphylococcus pseudintermedius]EIA5045868.1 gluconate permease [Staphylococcus pseudintermedius]MDK4118622.1 gluconate:H+ symporter [Staphylococcus pseudintermedius]MDT0918125.1 gluconate:H+ symporter [Staphylococcus pseudintermedius]WQJ77240.1 gluconate:H+ symporter [Staphylococcus pseudintermedius]HCS9098727.1 gluconate permease [Staphylococcus pseudintermedius]